MENSETIFPCISLGYDKERLATFLLRAFSNRCGEHETLLNRTKFMVEYIEFARANDMPIYGASSTITIAEWLDTLRARGGSVPQQGMHALTVFSEALELERNLTHPAIKGSKKDNPKRLRKQAPSAPLEFILAVEATSIDSHQCGGIRLFSSLFF